ncbi:MAG: hypothetical protein ABI137_04600 [Antricoccus sp.]
MKTLLVEKNRQIVMVRRPVSPRKIGLRTARDIFDESGPRVR